MQYDAVGNLKQSAETCGTASGLGTRTVTLSYDNANRLIAEQESGTGGNRLTMHGYDYANNQTSKTESGPGAGSWSFAYNGLNQLVSSSTPTGSLTYGYDLKGNRTSRSKSNGETTTYSYDADNRLLSVSGQYQGTALNLQYQYDYRGRRVSRAESGTSTFVVFSGGTSVQEWNGEGTTDFIRGSDWGGGVGGLLYSLRPNQPIGFTHYNHRGDVVAKTDGAGNLSWQAEYEGFGTRRSEWGTTPDRQKANTKEEDPSGLLNEGLRYRDLETGVFMTKDPAGFVDGPNLYAYVRQNPWSKFDPEGLAEDDPIRLPRHVGEDRTGYFIGKPGESTFYFDVKNSPELAKKYSNGVPFKEGRPDFSGYAPGSLSARGVALKTTVEVELTGDTTKDTDQVRKAYREQLQKELNIGRDEADLLVRQTLEDYRLHHHLDTNQIKVVPKDLHGKIAHYGERAAFAARAVGRGAGRAVGKALLILSILDALEDPGSVVAAPFGGQTQMGDATWDGYRRNVLLNSTDPKMRLDILRSEKQSVASFDALEPGYAEELSRREANEKH